MFLQTKNNKTIYDLIALNVLYSILQALKVLYKPKVLHFMLNIL